MVDGCAAVDFGVWVALDNARAVIARAGLPLIIRTRFPVRCRRYALITGPAKL